MSATPEPGFVGRRSERELLDEMLAAVRAGESKVLVIRGEPGIGKTALLRYTARQASGYRVAELTGVEAEMELPFAGIHQLCRMALDRLGTIPEPQRDALSVVLGQAPGEVPDRFLVGLAVLGLLAALAEERPLLCLIDDAQWIDAASIQTVGFVARRVRAESVAIVVGLRESAVAPDLDGLPALHLGGLPEQDARALLHSAVPGRLEPHVGDRLVAETGGNPLALLELPRRMTAAELAGGFEVPATGELPEHVQHIQSEYVRRVGELPEATQLLMLLAAAEPFGESALVLRAARRLGIGTDALRPARAERLLEIGASVRFRHPLVRSAVYSAAAPDSRQRVHEALVGVSDPDSDADRRAWHRALAATGPNEDVAAELERSAGRAQARGGIAATAAFLGRAVALTIDPGHRFERALAAAEANLYAGAFDSALRFATTAEASAVDELQRGRVELIRAQIAFASSRGGGAPALLLRAIKRIETKDAQLARARYIEALSAALFAGRLADVDGNAQDVARAVRAAPFLKGPTSSTDLLLDGWAALFIDGCAAAASTLQQALRNFAEGELADDELHLLWLATITAPVVWDDIRWDFLSRRHVELARNRGALSELPLALNSRSYIHLFRGELASASVLIDEARVAVDATSASLTPWGAIALAVLRGHREEASAVLDIATADATQRGEGISLTVLAWARALLHNALGDYDRAFAAAQEAINCPTKSAAAVWGMVELIEAAARAGEPETAGEVAAQFDVIAKAAATEWALGVNARSSALVSTGEMADGLYRESLDRLERCSMRVDLARAHLLYGEWLRRENRRVDSRVELHTAYDEFASMGLEAFAERARRELLATGETVRKRSVETRDDLTPQERQIAELARDGLSNPEIGARLFLSRRTVEWHLRHVFAKLGIKSRRELASALTGSVSELTPA